MAGAELIQNNARYQEDASSYDLKDSAGAVTRKPTETAMDNGVDDIIITDPFVNASGCWHNSTRGATRNKNR